MENIKQKTVKTTFEKLENLILMREYLEYEYGEELKKLDKMIRQLELKLQKEDSNSHKENK